MSMFTRPPGNPDALTSRADRILALAEPLDTAKGQITASRGRTTPALPTRRVAAYSAVSRDAATAVEGGALAVLAIARHLREYATELAEAQEGVALVNEKADELGREITAARLEEDFDRVQELSREREEQRRIGQETLDDLGTAQRQAAAQLNGEAEVWVPGAATSDPVDVWTAATANLLPQEITVDADGMREAWDATTSGTAAAIATQANKLRAAAQRSWQLYQLANYARLSVLTRNVDDLLSAAQAAYRSAQSTPGDMARMIRAEGDLLQALKRQRALPAREAARAQQMYKWLEGLMGDQRAFARARELFPHVPPDSVKPMRGPTMTRVAQVKRVVGPWAGRVMGPLSIASGGYDIYRAATDSSMSTTDRLVVGAGGVGGVAAGAATTAIALGLVAATPVGIAVIAVGSAVAIGSWAWQNREAIGRTATKAKDGVKKAAKKAWGWITGG